MSKRLWGACLALGMGWTSASGPVSQAKPPDLPVHPQVTCPEGKVPSGGYSDHEGGTTAPESTASSSATPVASVEVIHDLSWLEAVLPSLVARVVQHSWFWPRTTECTVIRAACPPVACRTVQAPSRASEQERAIEAYRQAQRIYLLGLEYQQQGMRAKARICFQEAHLASPHSRYGSLAMHRLQNLESELRDVRGAEEAEDRAPTPPRGDAPRSDVPDRDSSSQQYLDMLRRTFPLGTVPVRGY